ncbi:MAG: restriction endonuclease subunit S [Candidatus Cloacimonadota bacterium]|nr:restriction endonuclease subunit S [Candidatus Cloacimonadota bacterium]
MRKDWIECEYQDLLDYEQPTNYIVESTNYRDEYKTPVLTAGKSFIKGYTNETNGIFQNLPVIIFDDFTTATKYVNFQFKVKSSAMKILKPTSELVNMKLTYYYMQIDSVHNETHKRFWISIYSKKQLPLPPLPEQKAIVAKIEQLFSDLDNGIANLKKAQEQLKTYRQAVLKKAFEGELTKEWRKANNINIEDNFVKNLTEIGTILTGNTPSKKKSEYYSSKEYPFYKPTDLNAGNNVFNSIDGLSELGFQNGRIAPASSILVTCIGATIGKTGLIKKEGCFNQQINAIVPFKENNPEFIFYQAISVEFQNQIKAKASATTLPILNKGKFSKLTMIIFPLQEQQQIVQEIETRLSVCDNAEVNIKSALEKAESLRQSILKKAFEGKLLTEKELEEVRNDPEWEPAEKLLERIQAEKAKNVKSKKRKKNETLRMVKDLRNG